MGLAVVGVHKDCSEASITCKRSGASCFNHSVHGGHCSRLQVFKLQYRHRATSSSCLPHVSDSKYYDPQQPQHGTLQPTIFTEMYHVERVVPHLIPLSRVQLPESPRHETTPSSWLVEPEAPISAAWPTSPCPRCALPGGGKPSRGGRSSPPCDPS